jgi:hypothetical protein
MIVIDDVRKYVKAPLLPLAKNDKACERTVEKISTKVKRFIPDVFLSKTAVSDASDDALVLILRGVALRPRRGAAGLFVLGALRGLGLFVPLLVLRALGIKINPLAIETRMKQHHTATLKCIHPSQVS